MYAQICDSYGINGERIYWPWRSQDNSYFSAAVTVLGSPAVLPCSSATAFHGSSEALANQHLYVNVVQDLHQKLWFPDKHLFS